jgi:hypothetical protein
MHALDDHPDWHPEFLSNPAGLLLAVGLARAAVAEWACKMDRRKLDPLIDHHLYGQCAVQPARQQDLRASVDSFLNHFPQHHLYITALRPSSSINKIASPLNDDVRIENSFPSNILASV